MMGHGRVEVIIVGLCPKGVPTLTIKVSELAEQTDYNYAPVISFINFIPKVKKRDAVFIRRYVKRQLFFQRNVYEKDTNVPFLSKWYKKGGGVED